MAVQQSPSSYQPSWKPGRSSATFPPLMGAGDGIVKQCISVSRLHQSQSPGSQQCRVGVQFKLGSTRRARTSGTEEGERGIGEQDTGMAVKAEAAFKRTEVGEFEPFERKRSKAESPPAAAGFKQQFRRRFPHLQWHIVAISGRLNDGASLALYGGQHTTLYHGATGPLPRDCNSLQQHQAGLLHCSMKLIM
ncbi:unnamed protein product [Tetraodon nigroviridis]|uniref:(spotted green pufferfish) hypothetical protein n=1 Tax=Tetraodon nigroviridis TaxID=99883 RepID=Q4RNQ4_TETNG|nr:unnamed protein product [Tetraodon nigroviridis]